MIPTLEVQPAADQAAQSIRSARAAYFDRFAADNVAVDQRDPTVPPQIIFHTPVAKTELPQDLADTIIVGKIIGVQAYLSTNRAAIYTESTIAIEEVISSKEVLVAGPKIVLLHDGGGIRLSNGSVYSQSVRGSGNELANGGEYLFFLRTLPSLGAYGCSKAWSLTGGTVAAVSSDDLTRAANHTSSYQGMPVSEFLAIARQLKASLTHH
jgi:hypothetical protein